MDVDTTSSRKRKLNEIDFELIGLEKNSKTTDDHTNENNDQTKIIDETSNDHIKEQPQPQSSQPMSKNAMKRLKRKMEDEEKERKITELLNKSIGNGDQPQQQISRRQLKKMKQAQKEKENNVFSKKQKQTNMNGEKNNNNDNKKEIDSIIENNNNNNNNNNEEILEDEELETNLSNVENLITTTMLSESTFYTSENLRFVKPYYLDFTSWTKRRWIGRKLLDVFVQEFGGAYDRSYFEQKIQNSGILVDGTPIPLDFVLKDHQLITHKVHRHEPPVLASIPKIIKEDENMIVVEKPSSIPTHPTGRYRHNTLLFLMAHFHNKLNLFPINRLDKLTSGIMILAKNKITAAQLCNFLKGSTMQKEYLARVVGKFPNEQDYLDVDKPFLMKPTRLGGTVIADPEQDKADPRLRTARTLFHFILYDEKTNSSLIRAKPITGRTHQIRLHLKYLGHPIVNDPIYGSSPRKATQIELEITNPQENGNKNENNNNDNDFKTEKPQQNRIPHSHDSNSFDSDCPICKKPYLDPEDEHLELWLHAYSYSTPQWCFKTDLPEWCLTKNKEIVDHFLFPNITK